MINIVLVHGSGELLPSDSYCVIKQYLYNYNIKCDTYAWNNKTVNWKNYDFIIIREVYDYIEHIDFFIKWIDYIDSLNVKMYNSKEIILKNYNKTYMKNIDGIIPSIFIPKYVDKNKLTKILKEYDFLEKYEKFIIKPSISSNSKGCIKVSKNKINDIILNELKKYDNKTELIIQPFIKNIQNGEISLIFFDMEYSHSVLKKPTIDDFRIQETYGGKTYSFCPSSNLINISKQFIKKFITENNIKNIPFICRVDIIKDNNLVYLMELEMIEPDLYFDKNSTITFCKSIVKKIESEKLKNI